MVFYRRLGAAAVAATNRRFYGASADAAGSHDGLGKNLRTGVGGVPMVFIQHDRIAPSIPQNLGGGQAMLVQIDAAAFTKVISNELRKAVQQEIHARKVVQQEVHARRLDNHESSAMARTKFWIDLVANTIIISSFLLAMGTVIYVHRHPVEARQQLDDVIEGHMARRLRQEIWRSWWFIDS